MKRDGIIRTYDYAVVLRAVCTSDFMTADCTDIPFELLYFLVKIL